MLHGRGIGLTHLQMVCCALFERSISIWTRDRRLGEIAGSSGFARHFLSFSESVGDLVISTRLIATSEATSSRPLKGTGFSPYIRDSRLATELSSRLSRPAVEPKRSERRACPERSRMGTCCSLSPQPRPGKNRRAPLDGRSPTIAFAE